MSTDTESDKVELIVRSARSIPVVPLDAEVVVQAAHRRRGRLALATAAGVTLVVTIAAAFAVGGESKRAEPGPAHTTATATDGRLVAPGQVQHLLRFTPADAYAGGETSARGPLELNESGCLMLDGNLVAFPNGSKITDDGSIRMPDGRTLQWWVPTQMATFPTRPNKSGTQTDLGLAGRLDACMPGAADFLPAITLVTFLPDSSASHVPTDLADVLQRGDIEVADASFDNGLSADESLAAFTEVYEIGSTPVDATPYAVTVVSSQESRLSAGLEVRMVHVPGVEQDHSGPLVPPDSERSLSADLIYTDMFAFFHANTGEHLLTTYIGPAT